MFGKLFKFERQLQFRQVSFWVVVFIMFVLGFLSMSVDWFSISIEGGERIKNNGANSIALPVSVLSLGAIFFASVFVVTGMMRDDLHKSVEIIHATPVKNSQLLVPRMLGAWMSTFLCLFATVLGLFVGQFMPWIDQETLGPVRPGFFLHPTVVYLLVNSLFFTAFFALVAGLSRNKMLVYVSAVGLLAMYFLAGVLTVDAPKWLASLADPTGAGSLALETRYWPADEQNAKLAPFWGNIGINRLFWGGLGALMFLATYRLFNRGTAARLSKKVKLDDDIVPNVGSYKPLSPSFNASTGLQGFLTRLKIDYFGTVRSISFYVLCGIALTLISVGLMVEIFFEPDPTLPTSAKMARMAIGGFGFPVILVIIFFSGELMWRERTANFNEIIDTTPVKNWQLLLGKWAALTLVILTMLAFAMVIAILLQVLQGSFDIRLWTYIRIIFLSFGSSFIVLAGIALFIQNFMPHRVVGMFAAAAVLMFFQIFVSQIPFYHPLMGIGSISTGNFSELNGYQSLIGFRWSWLYNAMILGFLAVISIWIWRRGLQSSLWSRLKNLPNSFSPATLGAAALFMVGSIFAGSTIYKAYDKTGYRNSKAQEKRTVAYEKLFADYYKRPVPKIRSVEVDVDISPSRREGLFTGHYIVENTTNAPLEELFIRLPFRHNEDMRKLEISGASLFEANENFEDIKSFNYWLYKFDKAIAPGTNFRIDFQTYLHPPRLADASLIRRNGTFVNNWDTMPQLEIEPGWLQNPDKRRKYDLEELPKRPDQTDMEARQNNFISLSADYVDFKARVCTDPGQIPIAPGHRIKTEDIEINGYDRHCRTYEAITPILNFFSFLSGQYAEKRDVWENPNGDNVDIAIYYHESHDYNVDLMIEAAKASFDTFTSTFGPYQYKQMRIMEFPHASFAQAFAGTVPFSENIGFVRDPGDPDDPKSLDLASYVTMHEIGHQWFAHQIVPANTKGFNVLSEGMTENAALTAYEAKFGWQRTRQLLEKRAIEQYLASRVMDSDDEPALANAGNQQYLVYNKANWVFWGLKQYMGEEAMQGAIRKFLNEYGSKGPTYPTTKQLIEYLRDAASEDYQQLITDYWERITFWELGMKDVAISGSDGNYTVSLTATVDKKIATEETGKETSVTEIDGEDLNEWVEIGFYDKDPKDALGGDWIKLERVRITDLETPLTFTMPEKPTHIYIDPKRLLIERNVDDNMETVGKVETTEG